jgi:aminoglycoside 3-N-acetyltransferase I
MDYDFRQLGPSDLGLFRDLQRMFGEAFDDLPTYTAAPPSDGYVTSLLRKPHFIALACTQGTRVIGGLAAYVLEKFEQQRSEVYIYDLAVDEAHRRRGIATQLIEQLKGIATQAGAYVIFVQADPGDAPALALYESLGTREDVHHFDIEV